MKSGYAARIGAAVQKNYHFASLVQVLGAALFISLCAQIKIPLYFTPIPLTCQTLAVLFLGVALGARQATFGVLLYLAMSILGLPVLAGGVSDSMRLLGPSGGYLIGMPLQAYVAGRLTQNAGKSFVKIFAGLTLASALQLSLGLCMLSFFVGWGNVLSLGLYPFLPGEVLKIFFVASYLVSHRR